MNHAYDSNNGDDDTLDEAFFSMTDEQHTRWEAKMVGQVCNRLAAEYDILSQARMSHDYYLIAAAAKQIEHLVEALTHSALCVKTHDVKMLGARIGTAEGDGVEYERFVERVKQTQEEFGQAAARYRMEIELRGFHPAGMKEEADRAVREVLEGK